MDYMGYRMYGYGYYMVYLRYKSEWESDRSGVGK